MESRVPGGTATASQHASASPLRETPRKRPATEFDSEGNRNEQSLSCEEDGDYSDGGGAITKEELLVRCCARHCVNPKHLIDLRQSQHECYKCHRHFHAMCSDTGDYHQCGCHLEDSAAAGSAEDGSCQTARRVTLPEGPLPSPSKPSEINYYKKALVKFDIGLKLPSTQEELRGLGIEGDSLSPELVLAWIDGANPKSSAKSPPAVFTLMQKRVWHSARVALKRVRGKLRQRKSRGSHSAPKPPPQHPQSSSPVHIPGQEAMPSCPTPLTPQHHSTSVPGPGVAGMHNTPSTPAAVAPNSDGPSSSVGVSREQDAFRPLSLYLKSQVAASTAATWKVQLDMLLAILSNDGVPEATRQRAQRDVDFLLEKIEALMHAAVSAIPNDTFSRF
eukprot:CAMPEP_0177765642 /NCGR_PEP_ID=MMETSP0491_2-20121128/8099_1 /TAXON_ID=63592 /ORGANISM="Tetraselmis chuii, Strain PLY429" /LENGTH=389 /DNA_ID=CAMNT_0019282001 /DNA_START=151 /DNA_END=1320 /DNA_ORIENTATION=-